MNEGRSDRNDRFEILRRSPRRVLGYLVRFMSHRLPLFSAIEKTRSTAAPITLKGLLLQKVLGFNKTAYWPMHPGSVVTNANRIAIGIGTAPGLSHGCYIQGNNGIVIGDYTLVAPNVGLISASHSVYDFRRHETVPPLRIGAYCWIGMNAVVLPGVHLGDHTVVGSGAVVKDSFPEGACVLGGTPARVLRRLDRAQFTEYSNEYEFLGYHELAGRSKADVLGRLGIDPCAEGHDSAIPTTDDHYS